MSLKLISYPNTKTESYSFDLPAKSTCPGKSKLCAKHCYALQLERMYPAVDRKYKRNLIAAKSNHFISRIINELRSINEEEYDFRIHISGDFYSVPYIRKWITIASARPSTRFYAFTRSWRSSRLWPAIQELAKLPNVCISLSYDDETGEPPDASFKWAYMATDDDTKKSVRPNDVVFRTGKLKHKIVHRIGGCRVCPLERGIKIPLTCKSCRICIER